VSDGGARLRLRSIELQRFRGFRARTRVVLHDGINVLVGDNGSGKSSVCNAIEWCLFGREVETKGSGIPEYKDREIRHRSNDAGGMGNAVDPMDDGDDGHTAVALVFAGPDGEVTLTRTRDADAKANGRDDRLGVLDATGAAHAGVAAEGWLAAHGFPSWTDWRSSYCQHQEDARHRLLDDHSLRASLSALLGLEELVDLRNRLDAVKTKSHVKVVKRVEAQQSEDLLDLATAPGPVDEASALCARLGVDPQRVTREGARGDATRLLDSARDLGRELGLNVEVPESVTAPNDLAEVIAWAAGWPALVRSLPGKHSRLTGLRKTAGELSALILEIEPLAQQVTRAEEALRASLERDGDRERRAQALSRAREDFNRSHAARKAAGTLRALLKDATGVLNEAASDACPVCESVVPDLTGKVEIRLVELSSQVVTTLDEACDNASQAVQSAEQQVTALTLLETQLTNARGHLESKTGALRTRLPEADAEAVDPLAAARSALETTAAEIDRLEPLLHTRDQGLDQHQQDTERLAAAARYLDALAGQSKRVDVITLPAWREYQDSLDALVSLLVDCDSLSTLTNDLLCRRSEERLSVVNRNLGKYFSMITGEQRAAARGLTVKTKATATRLSYRVVDAHGEPLLPILNQASLNAIALAVLFAQAEDRAERGGPAFLVLDDPEQSLDADHIAGLARVLDHLTTWVPVIVALPPGGLETRLRDYASGSKHFIRLNAWDPTTGSTIRPAATGEAASP